MNFVMQKIICWSLCVLAVLCAVETSRAQGTAFMYQGRLNDGGSPATGNYDLRFQVYDAVTNGNAITVPLTNSATAVNNGLFTTTLDFGAGIFTGTNYWLQIGVQTNGLTNAFITLFPRQPVLPVPYAIFANSASNLLGTLAATQLSGTLPASAFAGYTNTVALTNGANLFSGTFNGTFNGTFIGNGTNLVNLNASQLIGGTVADARLSTNVALLNASQTFSGVNTFTNFGNSFRGSFFGNGLVGWLVQTGTTVQAVIDTGYVLTNSQLVTVALPTNVNIGDIVRISGAGTGGWKISQNTTQSVVGSFSGYSSSYWLSSGASSSAWIVMASSANGTRMAAVANAAALVFISTDSGQTWSGSSSSSLVWRSVAMSADGNRLIAGETNGPIHVSADFGSTWVGALGEPNAHWYSIAMSANGSNAVAAAYGLGLYASTNGGLNWKQSSNLASNWQSVASSANGSNLVAVINGGRIYTSVNAGSTWVLQTGAPNASWISVASSVDGSKLVAAINSGLIYTSPDFGVTWTPTSALSAGWECVASSADGGRLSAVVFGGGIYTSANFGVTWNRQNTAPLQNWTAICSSADASKLAASIYSGSIYYLSSLPQPATTLGTNGCLSGAQGSAVELQYIGKGQFMPVSSAGTIWAN
jgi:hypothetical protein